MHLFRSFIALILILGTTAATWSFTQTGKPKLVREPIQDAPTEEQKKAESNAPVKPDPVKAKKNFEVGKYYYGQKKWAAAADRFQLASAQAPAFVDAWRFLARSYEHQKKIKEAIQVFLDYEKKFPGSPAVSEFSGERERLEKKLKKEK
jgi:hypothetical protein